MVLHNPENQAQKAVDRTINLEEDRRRHRNKDKGDIVLVKIVPQNLRKHGL